MRSRFFFRRTAGCDRLLCAAACQIIFCIAVIAGKLILAESRAHIAVFQALHRLVEQDRRLSGIGVIGGVGGFVAGGAHSIAGAAGRTRIAGIAQQVQRFGGILFRVQQNPHTNGGIQLLPAVFAGKIRHTVVVVRAFLLALCNVIQQCTQAVRTGFVLPVPAQQAAADLIAGSLDLKGSL